MATSVVRSTVNSIFTRSPALTAVGLRVNVGGAAQRMLAYRKVRREAEMDFIFQPSVVGVFESVPVLAVTAELTQIALEIAAGGSRRDLQDLALASREGEGDREGELPLRGAARVGALAPEQP